MLGRVLQGATLALLLPVLFLLYQFTTSPSPAPVQKNRQSQATAEIEPSWPLDPVFLEGAEPMLQPGDVLPELKTKNWSGPPLAPDALVNRVFVVDVWDYG